MGKQDSESQTNDPFVASGDFYASASSSPLPSSHSAEGAGLDGAGLSLVTPMSVVPTLPRSQDVWKPSPDFDSSHLATLLLEAAARFVDLPVADFDGVLVETLNQLATYLHMEHVGLSLMQAGQLGLPVERRYVAGSQLLPSADELTRPYPWYAAQLRNGHAIILPNGAEDVPPEAEAERAYAFAQGLKCSLVLPLRIGEQLIGSLYFNSTTHAYTWSTPDLQALTIFARVLAGAAQRKQSNEVMRRNEEQLSLAIDAAGVGIWSWDLEHPERSYGSDNMSKIHGIAPCPKEQALQFYLAALQPAARAEMETLVMRCVAGEVSEFAVENELAWPDGSTHWIEARGYVVRDAAGHAIRLTGVMQEITRRKQAEVQIEQQRLELLRQSRIMEQTERLGEIGGWEWELASDVCYWTPETYRIYGLSPALYRPSVESCLHFYTPPSAAILKSALHRARHYGENFDLKLQIVTAQGKTIWVRFSGRIDVAGDEIVRLYGSIQDITLRTQVEEQLREAQKMEAIGQLAGGIAHDFNNLLTAINTMSELSLLYLNKAAPAPVTDRVRNYVSEIHRAGKRAADLTRQLLAFSRKQVLQPKVLDLRVSVKNAHSQLQALLGERIKLVLSMPRELGVVIADPAQVEQIIVNLAINARDAMPTGGTLTLRLVNVSIDEITAARHVQLHAGNYSMLEVQDTGHGMTPEVQARLFDPFFTTKVIGDGSGLGLATVYGVVKQSGGVIEVESQLGAGSTFRIYFPHSAPSLQNAQMPVNYVRGGTETVVVVDEDGMARQMACTALEAKGYSVLEAASARAAITLCQSFVGHIHLLVTNAALSDMSGVALANQVQLFRPEIRVLLLYPSDKERSAQPESPNPNTFSLLRPFSMDIFAAKVRSVLDAPTSMYLL